MKQSQALYKRRRSWSSTKPVKRIRSAMREFLARLSNMRREPGVLTGEHQLVTNLRIALHQAVEGFDEADMVFARLQIANGKHERAIDFQPIPHFAFHPFARKRTENRIGGDGNRDDFIGIDIVCAKNGLAREFAARQHAGSLSHGASYRHTKLSASSQ